MRAIELGYAALAITDECSLAGVVRAHGEAKGSGLKLLIGSSFTLVDGLELVLLATNLHGYGNLSELITLGRMRCEKGTYRLSRADLDGSAAHDIPAAAGPIDHLAGMRDCIAVVVPASRRERRRARKPTHDGSRPPSPRRYRRSCHARTSACGTRTTWTTRGSSNTCRNSVSGWTCRASPPAT